MARVLVVLLIRGAIVTGLDGETGSAVLCSILAVVVSLFAFDHVSARYFLLRGRARVRDHVRHADVPAAATSMDVVG